MLGLVNSDAGVQSFNNGARSLNVRAPSGAGRSRRQRFRHLPPAITVAETAARVSPCACRILNPAAPARKAPLIRPAATFSPRCGEKESPRSQRLNASPKTQCCPCSPLAGAKRRACEALPRAPMSARALCARAGRSGATQTRSFSPHCGEKVARSDGSGAGGATHDPTIPIRAFFEPSTTLPSRGRIKTALRR